MTMIPGKTLSNRATWLVVSVSISKALTLDPQVDYSAVRHTGHFTLRHTQIALYDPLMQTITSDKHTVGTRQYLTTWWRHQIENIFPALLALLRGIHRSPVNSPHKGHWHEALIFSLICAWINAWVNNLEAGDFGRHGVHCDVICNEWFAL